MAPSDIIVDSRPANADACDPGSSQSQEDDITSACAGALSALKRGVVATRGRGRGRGMMSGGMATRRMTALGGARGGRWTESSKKRKVDLVERDESDSGMDVDLTREIARLGTKLKSLQKEVDALKKSLSEMTVDNRKLTAVIETSKKSFTEQKIRLDGVDKKSRLLHSVLTWPGFSSIEKTNFRRDVKDVLSQTLRLSTNFLDRFVFRRIGSDGNKIFATALDEVDKSALFTTVRSLRPDNFYVNEYLTKENADLFYQLRKMKKDGHFSSVYSFRGDIYVKKSRGARSVLVTDLQAARKLSNDGLIQVTVPVEVHNSKSPATSRRN